MRKIKYEIDDGECITKCPFNKQTIMFHDIYVGSFACTEKCSLFVEKNKIEMYVTCKGVE